MTLTATLAKVQTADCTTELCLYTSLLPHLREPQQGPIPWAHPAKDKTPALPKHTPSCHLCISHLQPQMESCTAAHLGEVITQQEGAGKEETLQLTLGRGLKFPSLGKALHTSRDCR